MIKVSLRDMVFFLIVLSYIPLEAIYLVNSSYSSIDFPYDHVYINTAVPTIIGTLFDDNRQVVANQTVQILINDIQVGICMSDDNGIFRFSVTEGLSDGSYVIKTFCVEAQVFLGPNQFVVDTTLPVTVILYPGNGDTVTTNDFAVRGTTEKNARVTIFLDDDTYGEICYADESGSWLNDCFLENGAHSIIAQSIDIAGNQGPVSDRTIFLIEGF